MLRTIALMLCLGVAFGGITTTVSGCKRRRHKRYKGRRYKEKRYKRHKKKDKWKAKAPEISADEAKKSAKGIGKYAFKAAFKGEFDKLKGIALKVDDAKAFSKPELFQKYASKERMKERFEQWKGKLKKARFKKVKTDGSLQVKPGESSEKKWKKLAAQISKEVTVQPGKVFGKKKNGTTNKCSYVAIKLGDNNWRLARLKGCKSDG